jgi:3-oxoacyl-[acyl-carrier protein] reductase
MRLKDKVALVTGGGRDIGARSRCGWRPRAPRSWSTIAATKAAAQATVRRSRPPAAPPILVQADVTKPADVARLVAETVAAFGGAIDILVNLAGGMVARKTLAEMDEAFFDHVMELNLKSPSW